MSQTFTYNTGYSTDDPTREALYALFNTVFGIPPETFQDFYQKGFWDPTYTPFTLFDRDQAVANVSMFSMPILIDGQQIKAAGIQSVMTDPAYRGRGLMKQLFATMLAEIDKECDTAFLLTEEPELYTRYGFRSLQEHVFVIPYSQTTAPANNLRPLDFFNEEDLHLIKSLFRAHQPISRTFAPVSHASSFYLNMYNPYFNQKLFYSTDLQVAIVYAIQDDTLKLYDVIGQELPTLNSLCDQIPHAFQRIEFFFCPDSFTTAPEAVPFPSNTHLMVRGRFDMEHKPFKFPVTAAF